MEIRRDKDWWGPMTLEPIDLNMRIVSPWDHDDDEIEDEPDDFTTSDGVME